MYHGNGLLVEQSPVDADEDTAVAHGVVGGDERIVVACEQEHIAVNHIDMRLFHFDGQCQIDEGEVADLHLVLQVERTGGGHIGIGVILGEVAYRDAGMQCGRLVEHGLRIPDFQTSLNQRQMYNPQNAKAFGRW